MTLKDIEPAEIQWGDLNSAYPCNTSKDSPHTELATDWISLAGYIFLQRKPNILPGMHRLLRPYLVHCSLCCNCQWEAFGVTVPPAIECGTCIHQSLQFSLSSSLAEIRLGFFLLSGLLLGLHPPANISLHPFQQALSHWWMHDSERADCPIMEANEIN